MSLPQYILLRQRITRPVFVKFLSESTYEYNGDTSIEALQYFSEDIEKDIIDKFFRPLDFPIKSVNIEEVDDENLSVVFEIKESYSVHHKPEEKTIFLLMVNGTKIQKLNYLRFHIAFKDI